MFRWQRTDAPAVRIAARGVLLTLALGCASQQAKHESREAVKHDNWDAAGYHYLELVARNPDNIEARVNLTRARQNAAAEHFQRGLAFRDIGRLVEARDEVQMAVQLDPSHQFAEQVLEDLERDLAILERPEGRLELEQMKRQAREAKVKPPILDPTSNEPTYYRRCQLPSRFNQHLARGHINALPEDIPSRFRVGNRSYDTIPELCEFFGQY